MAAKQQNEMYLKLAKEQVSRATFPLCSRIRELKKHIEEQKEQLEHKDKIVIYRDKIQVQQK